RLVRFLTRPEVEPLLDAPDQRTWFGRRDHAFLLVVAQTGLRLSEMTGLTRNDVTLSTGAHVRVIGKGRKDRLCAMAHKRSDVPRKVMCRESRSISRRHWLLRSALVSRCVGDFT